MSKGRDVRDRKSPLYKLFNDEYSGVDAVFNTDYVKVPIFPDIVYNFPRYCLQFSRFSPDFLTIFSDFIEIRPCEITTFGCSVSAPDIHK